MTDRLDLSEYYLGDRVVVRYRLDDRRLTDVTGLLRDTSGPLMVEGTGPKERGELRSIELGDVASVRLLSHVTVRNSQIREVAQVLARQADVPITLLDAGWLLRAGSSAPLDNSAVPIGVDAHADGPSLHAITQWYQGLRLRPLLALPDRLIPDSHLSRTPAGPPTHVLVLPEQPSAGPIAVPATDRARGEQLRAQGYRLHHVLRHLWLDTYGDA